MTHERSLIGAVRHHVDAALRPTGYRGVVNIPLVLVSNQTGIVESAYTDGPGILRYHEYHLSFGKAYTDLPSLLHEKQYLLYQICRESMRGLHFSMNTTLIESGEITVTTSGTTATSSSAIFSEPHVGYSLITPDGKSSVISAYTSSTVVTLEHELDLTEASFEIGVVNDTYLTPVSEVTDLINLQICTLNGLTVALKDVYVLAGESETVTSNTGLILAIPVSTFRQIYGPDNPKKLLFSLLDSASVQYKLFNTYSQYIAEYGFPHHYPVIRNGIYCSLGSYLDTLPDTDSVITEIQVDNVNTRKTSFGIYSAFSSEPHTYLDEYGQDHQLFLDKYGQPYYLFMVTHWAFEQYTYINPRLCEFFALDETKNGLNLRPFIGNDFMSVTPKAFAISKRAIMEAQEVLGKPIEQIDVIVPPHAISRAPFLQEGNALNKLYTHTPSEIEAYLTTPYANNPYYFWSAEYLLGSPLNQLIEATHPSIMEKVLGTLDQCEMVLGSAYLNTLLASPLITLTVPDTSFYFFDAQRRPLSLRVHNAYGLLIDANSYSVATEGHRIILNYSLAKINGVSLDLTDGDELYIECLDRTEDPVMLVGKGTNRKARRSKEDYVLMVWDTPTQTWQDITASAKTYCTHVLINDIPYIQFSDIYANRIFAVHFGSGYYRTTITLTEATQYPLTVQPSRFISMDGEYWVETYENTSPAYQGTLEKISDAVVTNADFLRKETRHPECMETCGIDFIPGDVLKYTPSVRFTMAGYHFVGLLISYATENTFNPGANNTFATEGNITNLFPSLTVLPDDPEYPDRQVSTRQYTTHRISVVQCSTQLYSMSWDRWEDKTFFFPVTSDLLESDGSIQLSMHTLGDGLKRLAKVQAVYRYTFNDEFSAITDKLSYPLNGCYPAIYSGANRLMEGVDFTLENTSSGTVLDLKATALVAAATELDVTLIRKACCVPVITGSTVNGIVEATMNFTEATPKATAIAPGCSSSMYPINNIFLKTGTPDTSIFTCIHENYAENPCWFELQYAGDININSITIEPASIAGELHAELGDFFIECYNSEGFLSGVKYVEGPITSGVEITRFYAAVNESGRPLTGELETICGSRLRFTRRRFDINHTGFALSRIVVQNTHHKINLTYPTFKELGVRVAKNRVLPASVEYVTRMSEAGADIDADPTPLEVGDEVVQYGYELYTYNVLESRTLLSGTDRLVQLAINEF